MNIFEPLQSALAGGICGVIAMWLLGLYLFISHIAEIRGAKRRVVRMSIESVMEKAMSNVVNHLKNDSRFVVKAAKRTSDVLTLKIFEKKDLKKTVCNLALRFDERRSATRVIARMDMSPFSETTIRNLSIILFSLWPLWMTFVLGLILIWVKNSTDADLIPVIHMVHAIYPVFFIAWIIKKRKASLNTLSDIIFDSLTEIPSDGF